MSTQKNEHNPDNLTPEQVGEGFRLLTTTEVESRQAMLRTPGATVKDVEAWWSGQWCPGWAGNSTGVTYRIRITPPTYATGSGREGETQVTWVTCPICGEGDMERRPDGDEGHGIIICDNLNCASNGGTNREAIESSLELDEADRRAGAAERRVAQLTTQLEALRRDGERTRKALQRSYDQLKAGRRFLPSHGSFGEEGINQYEGAMRDAKSILDRAAIDSAQRQEGR